MRSTFNRCDVQRISPNEPCEDPILSPPPQSITADDSFGPSQLQGKG